VGFAKLAQHPLGKVEPFLILYLSLLQGRNLFAQGSDLGLQVCPTLPGS